MSEASSADSSSSKPGSESRKPSGQLSKGWIFLAVVVLLLGFFRLALKADWTFELLRGQAEQLLSETLGAEGEHIRVEIDAMQGDLLEVIELEGLRIYRDSGPDEADRADAPLIALEHLRADYVLLALIRKRIELRELSLRGLELDAGQPPGEDWNLMALLPPPDPGDEPEEDDDPFDFAVEIHKFSLLESTLQLRAPEYLPDEELRVEELQFRASLYFYAPDEELRAGLDELSFLLREGRLPEALKFETSADYAGETITLHHLALSTGRSLLEAEARHALDGSDTEAELRIPELSRADLAAYLDDLPEFERLSLEAGSSGDFSALELRLHAESANLFELVMGAEVEISPEPALRSAFLEIDELHSGDLLQDEALGELLSVGRLELRAEGYIPFQEYERAEAELRLRLSESAYDGLELSSFTADVSLQDGRLAGRSTLRFPQQQNLDIAIESPGIWEAAPEWKVQVETRDEGLNPGYFAQDEALEGRIPFRFTASGRGFELPASEGTEPEFWHFDMELPRPALAGFGVTEAITLNGRINALLAEAALDVRTDGGASLALETVAEKWQEARPAWELGLKAEALNLAELLDDAALETNLNLALEGYGEGYLPEDAIAEVTLEVGSSRFLGEPIEYITSELSLKEGVLETEHTEIESRFMAGFLKARQKLNDFKDQDNRLAFDFEFRNVENFAEPAGLDTLHTRGELSGSLEPRDGILRLESALRFEPVQIDSIHIEEVNGSLALLLTAEPELELSLDASAPRYGGLQLHDIRLENETLFADGEVSGSLDFRVLRTEDFGFFHEARFQLAEAFRMQNSRFSILEDGFNLELVEPFELRLTGLDTDSPSFRMDTLSLISDQGGTFDFTAEQGPGDYIMAQINADRLDMGACQAALMDEAVAEAYFSGRIDLLLEGEKLTADVDTELRDISYQGLDFDRFGLMVQIADNRLTSETRLEHEEELLSESRFELPFRLGDKETFPDAFYDEPVSGFFTLSPMALQQYEAFLADFGLADLEGTISLESELSGVAGAPELKGRFGFDDGKISGVTINKAFFEVNYDNEASELNVNSELHSMDQLAARLEGSLPLFIDMRSLTLEDPSDSEGLNLELETRDFELAAFNDFLDPETARDLRGRLDAEIDITGTVGQPEPRGRMALSSGRVYLPEQNITLRSMQARLDVAPDEIKVDNISAESSGSFSVSGRIGLEDFMPSGLDLRARARNFRVSNTRDMDLYVSMDNRIRGSMEEPRISGEFVLERGSIYLDNFGEEQVETVVLEGEEESTFAEDFYDALAVEMNVIITRRVFIRNRRNPELNLEMDSNLDAVKNPGEDLELFGEVRLPDGSATTLGRRFALDEGNIVFSGPVENPEFDIRLSYRIRREDDVRIIYIISGTAEEPEFSFDSEPEMEFQDIISYTLFGRPFYALEGWEQGVSGNAGEGGGVADAALDLLLDRLQNIAADRLGVDVVEIDSSARGSGGTRIKAGKFVSDRLFIALVQELGSDPNSQVLIEYLLRRNLELVFTGSDDFRSGVDVLWKLDY